VIPGLYAAGVDACTIYGDSYVFVLPGNTMGFALNTDAWPRKTRWNTSRPCKEGSDYEMPDHLLFPVGKHKEDRPCHSQGRERLAEQCDIAPVKEIRPQDLTNTT